MNKSTNRLVDPQNIDRLTILSKRAEAESLELKARRLRAEADEIENKITVRFYIAIKNRAIARYA